MRLLIAYAPFGYGSRRRVVERRVAYSHVLTLVLTAVAGQPGLNFHAMTTGRLVRQGYEVNRRSVVQCGGWGPRDIIRTYTLTTF